jgi:arylsulfatase
MILDVDHPGGDGALVARGSRNSGFVLYVKNGRCVFDYNAFHEHSNVVANTLLATGRRRIEVVIDRQPDGSANVTMLVDGQTVGSGAIPRLLLLVSSLGMDFGRSPAPVNDDYAAPFAYSGAIRRVSFEIPPIPPELASAADRAGVLAAQSRQ